MQKKTNNQFITFKCKRNKNKTKMNKSFNYPIYI